MVLRIGKSKGPGHLARTAKAAVIPVAYSPSAVLFHGTVGLRVNAGTGVAVTNSSTGLESFWLMGTVGSVANLSALSAATSLTNRDIIANTGLGSTYNSETVPGRNYGFDDANGTRGRMVLNNNDHTGNTSHNQQSAYNDWHTNDGVWTHVLFAYDVSGASPGKMAIYINGVKQSLAVQGIGGSGYTPPLLVDLANSRGWGVGTNSGNASNGPWGYFAIADLWVSNGAETQGLLDASSNLSAATVAKFIDSHGKPVDLGAAGSAPFGVQPPLFFSGDKTAWATNKGFGGAVTFVAPSNASPSDQTLTASTGQALMNYPYGPAGQTRACPKWAAPPLLQNSFGTVNATTGTTGFVAGQNLGMPIASGDRLLMVVTLRDSSNNNDRVTGSGPFAAPAGWSVVGNPTHGFPGFFPMNVAVITRVADASDVTAAGSDWAKGAGGDGNGGPPTIHYQDYGADTPQVAYQITNLGACAIDQTAGSWTINTSSASITIPGLSPTQSASCLLAFAYDYSGSGGVHQAPSGLDTLLRASENGSSQGVFINWKYLNSNAAVASMTATQANASNAPTFGWSMNIY